MRKKLLNISTAIVVTMYVFVAFLCNIVPFSTIYNLDDNLVIASYEVEEFLQSKPFGNFINFTLHDEQNCSSNTLKIDVNLFSKIKLKTLNVEVNDIEVFTGGNVVGFSLSSNGVIVIGSGKVETINGPVDCIEDSNIKVGDVIFEINEEKINKVSDLTNIVNKKQYEGKELKLKVKRKDKVFETTITPAKDIQSNQYKLGLWIKDDASGVGTLTYIRKDNYRFGALGHSISENGSKEPFSLSGGDMYTCNVIGVNKGAKGKPGEVKALFIQGKNSIGDVDKNTKYGVFGNYNQDKVSNLDEKKLMKVGGRFTAKPGKAKIRCALDGKETKDYDIEIIKTNYQNSSNEKSMVIRVIDKELISKTGGIIQGMSGSPILQNDKVIGAVTHVFVSDPTKGFAVYLDWMINE